MIGFRLQSHYPCDTINFMRHGSRIDPPNRFERVHRHSEQEQVIFDHEYIDDQRNRNIELLADDSRSIVSKNDSPDVPFRYSMNPYRGCIHGCAYCYARPTHEYMGLNAGLDFETKIFVKHHAPALFEGFLRAPSWRAEPIAFSGVTDCYQPAERDFQLTRQCLNVALRFHQPIDIVTKNALVARDLDILATMAADNLVRVFVSVTTLDGNLARDMEPRTSIPTARLRTIAELAAAHVPVGLLMAPIIPGLNDSEIPAILKTGKDAGATAASCILLRLPSTVEPVFIEWLQRTQPDKADRVLERIRATRGGKLNDSNWHARMKGTGEFAEQIRQLFQIFRQRYGLASELPPSNRDLFRHPEQSSRQLRLF
jgi:DNA repair photolyase